MPKPPVLFVRAEDATSLANPVIGGAGTDSGSPSFSYGAAKFGNGVDNTVASTGKKYASIRPDIGLFSIGCWSQFDNVSPASHGDCVFWGCSGSFTAPSIAFGLNNSLNIFNLLLHTTATKYIYLRIPLGDLSFTANGQLQYLEVVLDSTGLTAGTAIGDGNVGTMIKIYSTDSSGVLASRTITNGSDTYAGGITFGDFQTAGAVATDLMIAGNNITGIANNAYVDNLKVWDYARTITEMADREDERGSLNDQWRVY